MYFVEINTDIFVNGVFSMRVDSFGSIDKESLAIILDGIIGPFFILDNQWMITYLNKDAANYLKLNREEVLGRKLWDIVPKLVNTGFYHKFVEAMEHRKTIHFETKGVYNPIYAEIYIHPLREGLAVCFRDITERKLMEKALRQSEERFYKAFYHSPDIKSISDLETGVYIDVNDQFLKTFGYTREEVIGHKAEDLIWEPGDRPKLVEMFLQDGKIENLEHVYRDKSGRPVTLLFSVVPTDINGKKCVLSAGTDITKLKQLEKEMARLDRLHLIGEIAAGIGHEIRNPMTTVRGFLQLLNDKDSSIKNRKYYDLMIDELDRANSIVTEFLSLAKNKRVELKEHNLNTLIKDIFPLLQSDSIVFDKYIELNLNNVINMKLNEKEIRQLILNLVRNGLETMPSGKTLKIKTYMEGEEVVLAVEDQGGGIPPEITEKIGTPFFTTKDSGTGLGLAVCYSIAARHNARIDFKTSPEGTEFFVRFSGCCITDT